MLQTRSPFVLEIRIPAKLHGTPQRSFGTLILQSVTAGERWGVAKLGRLWVGTATAAATAESLLWVRAATAAATAESFPLQRATNNHAKTMHPTRRLPKRVRGYDYPHRYTEPSLSLTRLHRQSCVMPTKDELASLAAVFIPSASATSVSAASASASSPATQSGLRCGGAESSPSSSSSPLRCVSIGCGEGYLEGLLETLHGEKRREKRREKRQS